MRDKGQVGQIICRCGRVAELRTRGNGQRLPFLMCKHCGMQQGKAELRAEWLSKEDATCSLGTYGEFPGETSKETNQVIAPEQKPSSNEDGKNWTPPDELKPEALEPEIEATPDDTGETSTKGLGLIPKVCIGIVSAIAFGFGVKKLNLAKKIKE